VPKGYIIITEDIKDPAGMAEYAKLAGKAMTGSTLEFESVSLSPKLTFGRKSASRSRQNVDFGGD